MTSTRTGIAHDHERCRFRRKAFTDVGASGLFTNRIETGLPHHLVHAAPVFGHAAISTEGFGQPEGGVLSSRHE